jgi:predicted 2-oxoglutarate/Fe(II)-dependent dioxygenase YbiX
VNVPAPLYLTHRPIFMASYEPFDGPFANQTDAKTCRSGLFSGLTWKPADTDMGLRKSRTSMPALTTDLARILASVRRPGDFFVSGTAELRTPSLWVDGVGPIALPLLPAQAAQLATVAEPAPYGRGEETLVDPAVRRSWQIAPQHVQIGGRGWTATLDSILAQLPEGLGVDQPISAELHKLLLYETGGFFVGHRDTEKAPGMFATLVVVLPSDFAGGELIVRNKGREVRLDLHRDDPAEIGFAAFYADCVHEVLPVTGGYRLTLVYNLLRSGGGKPPEPPGYEREQARLVRLLETWSEKNGSRRDDDTPDKVIHILEHAYTQAELISRSSRASMPRWPACWPPRPDRRSATCTWRC